MAGYTRLAAFMTENHHPILKKYQDLAIRDLLYLQAELCELQDQHTIAARRDETHKDDDRQFYDRDWLHLAASAQKGLGGEQWAIALALRAKLREYYTAMTQYSQVASIPQPKSSERDTLESWIKSSSGGACAFLGRDLASIEQPSVYDAIHQNDLAILSDSHGEDDSLTRFMNGPLVTLYHRLFQYWKAPLPKDPEKPPVGENRSSFHSYEQERVNFITNLLGTTFSSLAPLVSIIVLSFVRNERARLGIVCAFTILFSFTLAIATKARRVEIFAATAAFASVQVVFIGTSNSNN